jgi:YesN/AraC family two-component response regulator
MKILIADDEELGRSALKNIIFHIGHEVIEASNGDEAWVEFIRHRPRIVISDLQMPLLSGVDFCRKIRQKKDAPYTYFILVSGQAMNSEIYQDAMEKEVDDFLLKPIRLVDIRNRLRVAERILGLTKRVHELETCVPICSYCKRIRRSDGEYEKLETYINGHSELSFSHGICPDCMENKFSEKGT